MIINQLQRKANNDPLHFCSRIDLIIIVNRWGESMACFCPSRFFIQQTLQYYQLLLTILFHAQQFHLLPSFSNQTNRVFLAYNKTTRNKSLLSLSNSFRLRLLGFILQIFNFPKDIKIGFDTYRLLLIFSDFIDELEIKQGDRNLKMNYAKSIYYSSLQFYSNTQMFKESYILFKQFLPKELNLGGHKAHQTVNLQSITKQLKNQPKNTSLHLFKQTSLSKQRLPFPKPFEQQYHSNKKVLKLKTRGNLNNIISAKITQQSSRSQFEFMDDNVWKQLSHTKTKKIEDLIKEIPRKINKPNIAIIFKTNKEIIDQNRENQADFVKRNLMALRKIVRSQSEQKHNLQMMRLELIHAKKARLKSNTHKQETHEQLLRKQQKNDFKLKMLSRLIKNNHSSEKLAVKEIKKRQKKTNPYKYLNITEVPVNLKASKVIFQRKNSLKREIIDKIRRDRAVKHQLLEKQPLKDLNYISSYPTQGDQSLSNRNLSFHVKRRFKSEQSQLGDVDNQLMNNTQKCQKKKAQWDDFIGQPIQPW